MKSGPGPQGDGARVVSERKGPLTNSSSMDHQVEATASRAAVAEEKRASVHEEGGDSFGVLLATPDGGGGRNDHPGAPALSLSESSSERFECDSLDANGEDNVGGEDGDDNASCHSSTASAPPALLLLFLLSSIGASLPYISALSSLVPLSARYGPDSFVYLNLAVYVPLLPVSLLQARYDHEYDAQVGSYRAFLFRGAAGFALSAAAMASYPPAWGRSLTLTASCAAALGASGAALQGTLNQMASFVSPDPTLKAAVSAGLQCSAFVVLAASLWTGFGGTADAAGMMAFYGGLAAVQALGCGAAFLTLMRSSRNVARAMLRRDSSIAAPLIPSSMRGASRDDGDDGEAGSGNPTGRSEVTSGGGDCGGDDDDGDNVLSYRRLWSRTAPCAWTLLLTLVPSFTVGSWFTHVRTTAVALPQVLFYVRIASDLLGRLLTAIDGPLRPKSVRSLTLLAGGRILIAAAFFVHAATDPETWFPHGRDAVSAAFVAIIAGMSGYLVTGCYQLAPGRLRPEEREENLTKQAGILNIAFAVAALVGIGSSLVLSGLGL